MEFLFVVGGVWTSFLEEKPTIDCDKLIDELDFSTPISEPDPNPTSSNQPTQKFFPYHHPHHKIEGMENMISDLCRRGMKVIIVD